MQVKKPSFLLRGLDFTEEELLDLDQGQAMLMLMDLGYQCNYDCIYCGTSFQRNQLNSNTTNKCLSTSERKAIIKEAVNCGIKTVCFGGCGEPVLEPDFSEILKYNYQQGLTTILFTNMSTLDNSSCRLLLENDTSLIVKVDSVIPERYNQLTGGENYPDFMKGFASVKQAYARTTYSKNGRKVARLAVCMALTLLNEYEVETIRDIAHDELDAIFCCKVVSAKGKTKENETQLLGTAAEKARLVELAHKYTDLDVTVATSLGICGASWMGVVISNDGGSLPCNNMLKPYGYAQQESLRELICRRQQQISDFVKLHNGLPACFSKWVAFDGKDSTPLYSGKLPRFIKL